MAIDGRSGCYVSGLAPLGLAGGDRDAVGSITVGVDQHLIGDGDKADASFGYGAAPELLPGVRLERS
jgi:hypothetical protein